MNLRSAGLLVLLLASGCGVNVPPPPSDLDDACVIIAERPQWLKAMNKTAGKWQVPVAAQLAVIYQESKFRGDARTPLRFELGVIPMGRASSALGYAQAIDSTWQWYQRETGNTSGRRENFDDSVDFMGWYMNRTLERNGVALTDVRSQYLAYHDGHSGFARGSYKRKRWLVRIAGEVSRRAIMYEEQLATCPSRG